MSHYIENLPQFSAERYFLLSEIEQKASLVEVCSTEDPTTQDHANLIIFYKLIDMSNCHIDRWNAVLESFLSSAWPFIADEYAQVPKVMLVDVLVQGEKDIETAVSGYEIMTRSCGLASSQLELVMGVSDHVGVCPGLEKCYDLLEAVRPGYSKVDEAPFALLVVENRSDLQGADPTREPDAASGVFQACITSRQNSLQQIADQVKEKLITDQLNNVVSSERVMWQPLGFALVTTVGIVVLAWLLVLLDPVTAAKWLPIS